MDFTFWKVSSIHEMGVLSLKQRYLLLHEVMHFSVNPLNDGHQIVKNVLCVIHGWIHEVPEKDKVESLFREHNRPLMRW